jgi:hypothetical protein
VLAAHLRHALASRLSVREEGATAEELAAQASQRGDARAAEAAAVLLAAERARFAGPGAAGEAPSAARLRTALESLRA